MNLPWAPLVTIERSGLPEVTVYGIVSVVDGSDKPLLAVGDQQAKLWTRSVLKPWQLLNHIHVLKESYSALRGEHYALMLSSHSSDLIHEKALDEILAIGGVDESVLQNTPLYPHSPKRRSEMKALGAKPKSRWGDCSGKHAGFVLALNALKENSVDYLNKEAPHFARLKKLLAYLLQLDWAKIPETTDGCRLPNYAFAAPSIARLYWQLLQPLKSLSLPDMPVDMQNALSHFEELHRLMMDYPVYVGGERRLDTKLMQGEYSDINEAGIIAKEGADGLLSIGVAPSKKYPKGLGILIKSSSGNDPRYFSLLVPEVFYQLGILKDVSMRESQLSHVKRKFHFHVAELAGK